MARVFVDTNVLFPFSLMDLMLSLAEDYVHDMIWSDRLLDEWQRVIVREGHRSAEAATLIVGHIRTGFADSCIPEGAYKYPPYRGTQTAPSQEPAGHRQRT
jgi:PIN domain